MNTKPLKSVTDLFQMDITKIQYEEYICGTVEINDEGKEYKSYRKSLNYQECGIFDIVEVLRFSPTAHNITLYSCNWNREIEPLEKLVNDLNLLLGDDSTGNGRFTNIDRNRIINKDHWRGRNWDEPWSIMLYLSDFDDKEISISIHYGC